MYLLICTHGDIVSFPIHWPEKCMGICLLLLSVCSLIVYKKISMYGNVTAMGYMFIFYHRPDQMINFFNILLADGHAVKILCRCEWSEVLVNHKFEVLDV